MTDSADMTGMTGCGGRLHGHRAGAESEPAGAVRIDCDHCAARGAACRDCVVSVLLGAPEALLDDERAALDVLADAGMAPRLRLVPVRRGRPGVA